MYRYLSLLPFIGLSFWSCEEEVLLDTTPPSVSIQSPNTNQFVNEVVTIIVETNDIDVTYNEAVMKGDKSIGYVTSGGFAHFINKSIAFSYLDTKELNSGKGIQVEINGDMFNCSIIKDPLYDPSGKKMRS